MNLKTEPITLQELEKRDGKDVRGNDRWELKFKMTSVHLIFSALIEI